MVTGTGFAAHNQSANQVRICDRACNVFESNVTMLKCTAPSMLRYPHWDGEVIHRASYVETTKFAGRDHRAVPASAVGSVPLPANDKFNCIHKCDQGLPFGHCGATDVESYCVDHCRQACREDRGHRAAEGGVEDARHLTRTIHHRLDLWLHCFSWASEAFASLVGRVAARGRAGGGGRGRNPSPSPRRNEL